MSSHMVHDSICTTCFYASWGMTNHHPPRINPNMCGRCRFIVLNLGRLPVVINRQKVLKECNPEGGHAIWSRDDFEHCATWRAK